MNAQPPDLALLIAAYEVAEARLADAVVAVNALAASVAAMGREIARINPDTDEWDRRKIERDHPRP
jgi:hypothetical protein